MKSAIGIFSWTFHITSLSLHTHPIFRSRVSLFVSRPRGIFLCKWCRMDEWCKMNWNWLSLYRVESRLRPRGKLNVLGELFVMLSMCVFALCIYSLSGFWYHSQSPLKSARIQFDIISKDWTRMCTLCQSPQE